MPALHEELPQFITIWLFTGGRALPVMITKLPVQSDATGGQVECNFAPDDQTNTAHTENPSCASTQEGFF